MSRLSYGFTATALVIALAFASIQLQLNQVGWLPPDPLESFSNSNPTNAGLHLDH